MQQLDPEVLSSYIEELGLSYKTNSLSYIFDCPKCNKSVLYMYRTSGIFRCMKCVFKGRPEYALSDLAGIPVGQVKERLYGSQWVDTTVELDLDLEDFFGEDDDFDIEIIPEIKWKFDEYPIDHKFSVKGLAYLESRGISFEVAQKYHIRHSPTQQRVLIPMEVNGRLLGHQGRLIVPNIAWDEESSKYKEAPKIISTDNFPNSRVTMFADNLKGSEHAIVCEGPFDALKFDYCGGNIATTGKAVSKGQCNFIRSYGVKRVYLALDSNAYNETNRLVQEFSDLATYVLKVPKNRKDFGECSFEECYQVFMNAELVFPGELQVYFGNT